MIDVLTNIDVLDIMKTSKEIDLRWEYKMEQDYQRNARVFKAFCDENRLKILKLLQSGEKCACKLLEELQIGQSTLSHHMRILCDSGVVQGRKEGKWMHYSISPQGVEQTKELLDQITSLKPAEGQSDRRQI